MMEESYEIENTTAGRTDQNLSPTPRLDSNDKDKWNDGSNTNRNFGDSKTLVPESWELAVENEADSEYTSKQNRGERRRNRQRERRQQWRHDKWKVKAETIPDVPSELSKSNTDQLDRAKRAKRHRRSPQERTISFLVNLFQYDTRPADWDLVCIQPGEYAAFPYHQAALPLSRLSALIWKTEYESREISCLTRKGLEKVEATLIEKERELIFYEEHMRNMDVISQNLSEYSGEVKNLPPEPVTKVFTLRSFSENKDVVVASDILKHLLKNKEKGQIIESIEMGSLKWRALSSGILHKLKCMPHFHCVQLPHSNRGGSGFPRTTSSSLLGLVVLLEGGRDDLFDVRKSYCSLAHPVVRMGSVEYKEVHGHPYSSAEEERNDGANGNESEEHNRVLEPKLSKDAEVLGSEALRENLEIVDPTPNDRARHRTLTHLSDDHIANFE
ncbi:hypothetical protein FHL15_005932 [Xylaria flabelliformis]|uniref:Uncharacterized protein n=1 Tax=Xylaria flabelliformis TaxID=2512241 RepID=A0A553HYQ4_9PEZI|nr:hypothetical protein FHL15_005932 [Xylaria flabelliformis]